MRTNNYRNFTSTIAAIAGGAAFALALVKFVIGGDQTVAGIPPSAWPVLATGLAGIALVALSAGALASGTKKVGWEVSKITLTVIGVGLAFIYVQNLARLQANNERPIVGENVRSQPTNPIVPTSAPP